MPNYSQRRKGNPRRNHSERDQVIDYGTGTIKPDKQTMEEARLIVACPECARANGRHSPTCPRGIEGAAMSRLHR